MAEGEDLLDAALAAGIAPFEVLAAPDVGAARRPAACVEPATARRDVGTLGHAARVLGVFRRADLPRRRRSRDLALELHGVRDPGNVGHAAAVGWPRSAPASSCSGAELRRSDRPAGRAGVDGRDLPRAARCTPRRAGLRVALDARRGATLGRRRPARRRSRSWSAPSATGIPRRRRPTTSPRASRRRPGVDSLNAAMAGTVALYETRRQRAT